MYPDHLENNVNYRFTFPNTLNLIRAFVEYDYNILMHIQEFFEINIVIRGTGMHYIENKKVPVKQGDIFIIPPNVSHGYVGGSGFDVYHFLFHNKFMEKYRADLQILPSFSILFNIEPLMRISGSSPLHLSLTDVQFEEIKPLLSKLQIHSAHQTPSAAILCNSLAMILITLLCQIYTENTTLGTNRDIQDDVAFMNALALIHERYHEKISISQLAKTAQMSRSSFIRKFHDVCKKPPAKYLTETRIEAAKHLLSNTTYSISDIAVRTGFYDASHFVRIFSAETGSTPTLFRSKASLNPSKNSGP